jgi:uncharacterized protein YjbI with pentapeptide repeats
LNNAHIIGADLKDADLRAAILDYADLSGSNLVQTELGAIGFRPVYWIETMLGDPNARFYYYNPYPEPIDAYPIGNADVVAHLFRTNLSDTDLTGARVYDRQLKLAGSLWGATLPDGTMYDGRYQSEKEEGFFGWDQPYPYPYP